MSGSAGPARFVLVLHSRLNRLRRSRTEPPASEGADLDGAAAGLLRHLSVLEGAGPVRWGRLAGPGGAAWVEAAGEALSENLLGPSWAALRSDGRSQAVHDLLDALPPHLAFLLDVVWILPKMPSLEETPRDMYSCLKRAKAWHGANVVVMPLAKPGSDLPRNDMLEDLRAEMLLFDDLGEYAGEFFDSKLTWRGSISVYDSKHFEYRDMESGFELVAADVSSLKFSRKVKALRRSSSGHSRNGPISAKRLSGRLKFLAATERRRIPREALTDKAFALRTTLFEGDDVAESAMTAEDSLLSEERCVLARLEYCEPDEVSQSSASTAAPSAVASALQSTASSRAKSLERSGKEWRRWVCDGFVERDWDENMAGLDTEALHFVIFGENESTDSLEYRNVQSKTAVLLDPHAVKILSCFATHLPAKLEIEQEAETRNLILRRFYGASEASGDRTLPEPLYTAESNWPEWRLMCELEHAKKIQAELASRAEALKPSGDYVVMKPEELLKFFTKDGDAKDPDKLVPIRPKRTPLISTESEVRAASFEDALTREHPSLSYNRDGGADEEMDRECQRIQRLQIGPFRETASTCILNGDNKAEVVSKPKLATETRGERRRSNSGSSRGASVAQKQSAINPPGPARRSDRRRPLRDLPDTLGRHGSLKRACSGDSQPLSQRTVSVASSVSGKGSTRSREEVFKQKVRGAVFDALAKEGVEQNHPLFRMCFRHLFDIVKMYGGGDGVGSGGSTKEFLAAAASNNAKLTISMVKKKVQSKENNSDGLGMRKRR